MQRKFISRRSFLKCAGVGAVTAAAAGLLAGCGGSDSSSSGAASSAAPAEPADPNKPYAGVTLYYTATDTEATGPEMQDIVAMVKEKTGINIEFNIIPKADTGEVDKRLVSLQAGDELDIVYGTVAQLKVSTTRASCPPWTSWPAPQAMTSRASSATAPPSTTTA